MCPRLIFSVFIILCSYLITAQETLSNQVDIDYRHFKEIFFQEVDALDTSTNVNRISIHPASLPEWLTVLPVSDENSIYAIGISDPGMDIGVAIELAYLRAKIVSALLVKPKISSVTDNYSKEGSNSASNHFITKYVNYYQIIASIIGNPEQFQIVNQYFTSFNEAIVLVKYSPGNIVSEVMDSLMLTIDIYQAERQFKNRFEFDEKCEMYGLSKLNNNREDINLFYYFYRAVNQFYEIVSRYNGQELDFPQNIFKYQGLSNTIEVNEANYKLNYGLWKAFLQSLVQSYISDVTDLDLKISQIDDSYTSSSQNLSRELIKSDPSFRMTGLRIVNNRLSVLLNKYEVSN